MSIFGKLFGAEDKKTPVDEKYDSQFEFSEGDIFYIYFENEFRINKLLKIDREFETFHILSYRPIKHLPKVEDIRNLDIFIHHAPIAKNGFENPKLLAKSQITSYDLLGYHEYLKQTADSQTIVSTANNYYLKGIELADEKKYKESIDEYSKAFDLFPQFYEAVENRGFSKMDLGLWNEAIEDFRLSLEVFPKSLSGIFSIGECYLKMGKIGEAEKYFKQALLIDPNDQSSNRFLEYVSELRKHGLQDEDSPDKIFQTLRNIMQK